jgi:hypothetical protein
MFMAFAKSMLLSVLLHVAVASIIYMYPQNEMMKNAEIRESDIYKLLVTPKNQGWICRIELKYPNCNSRRLGINGISLYRKGIRDVDTGRNCNDIVQPLLPELGCEFDKTHPEDLLNLPQECWDIYPVLQHSKMQFVTVR